MRKSIFLSIIILLPLLMTAQKTEKAKFGIKFSGYIRSDMVYNTRQMLSARGESHLILVPKAKVLDAEGNDINAASNFNFNGLSTRMRANITGPDAFGAKTSGKIEVDFLGPNGGAAFAIRMRHAFVKLKWESSSLITGQYWHPMFVTECFPGTVSFGAGIPFNPLARNPQIRFTKELGKVNVLAAALSQGLYKSKAGNTTHQNSGIPNLHLQLQFKDKLISSGLGVDYQVLRPLLVTSNDYVTNQTVSSVSFVAYTKLKLDPITIKLYGLYGQNNDNMVAMGGFAVTDKQYTPDEISKGFVEYTPYNTLNYWADVETTGKKVKYGLFTAMSQNLGANEAVLASTYKGRWGNVNSIMRIAPRVKYKSGKVAFGFEFEYTSMQYAEQKLDAGGNPVAGSDPGGINEFGKVSNYYTVENLKPLLSLKYSF